MRKEKLADTLCLAFGLVEIVFPSEGGDGFQEFLRSMEQESDGLLGRATVTEEEAELPDISGLKWTAHACTWHNVTLPDGRSFRALECHGMKKIARHTYRRGGSKCWGFKWAA